MSIQVKFFASLRERMGREGAQIDSADIRTAADVWAAVSPGEALPGNTLIAVNMEYAGADAAVADGDEVGFFPPVTGG